MTSGRTYMDTQLLKSRLITLGVRPRYRVAFTAQPRHLSMSFRANGSHTPPLGGAEFWLIRLACTLRRSGAEIAEAVQTLYLRPRQPAADPNAAYAYSLYPDRLGVEDNTEITIGLKPELKFTGAEAKGGELGAKIVCHKVFPVIQSYNAGTPTPYWAFRSHVAYPLEGTQFVYAVVAARSGSNGARASIELVVTAQTQLGSLRFGLPEEARAHTSFTIP